MFKKSASIAFLRIAKDNNMKLSKKSFDYLFDETLRSMSSKEYVVKYIFEKAGKSFELMSEITIPSNILNELKTIADDDGILGFSDQADIYIVREKNSSMCIRTSTDMVDKLDGETYDTYAQWDIDFDTKNVVFTLDTP